MKNQAQDVEKQVENEAEIAVELAIESDENIQETVSEDAVELLNQIEPAAGEAIEQNELPAAGIFNSNSFRAETQDFQFLGAIEAEGILDETELEYGVLPAAPFVAPLPSREQNDDDSGVVDAGAPPVIEVTLPEATIRLSNATTDQRYINDMDHFGIEPQNLGKNYKLFGEEMDIQSVSDDALVRYNFKTEDSFRAVLKTAWNTVKNIDVESADLNNVVVKNFVHADINLSGDADKTVKIIDAKRGFIETDAGDDVIVIKALTNGSGWSNTFEIDSGAGNDRINVKGDDGYTIANIQAGEGDDVVKMRGDYHRSDVDLGEGDDVFKNGMHEDVVRGGGGNDIIKGGAGNDVLYGGAVEMAEASLIGGQLDFEFVKSQAGYKNTVGFYEVSEDGTIESAEIVFENLKALSVGDEESYEIDSGANVRTFIVANGYNQNGRWEGFDFESGDVSFLYNYGEADERAATIYDDADLVSLIYTDAGQTIEVKGHVFHDVEGLNKDGKDHTIETIDGNQSEFAYEDLYNLGDRDYSDAVFNLTQSSVHELSYTNSGDDNDVLRGGADNDLITGGCGDDVIKGGSGEDITVFMGSADEYIITKTGGKYTIEDTVEGRDGVDTLQGVEGILFGVEDLYLDILNNWTDAQIDAEFDVQTAEEIDLADLLEGYSPVQDAIDSFVQGAEIGSVESVSVQNDIPALAILNTEDALANSFAENL